MRSCLLVALLCTPVGLLPASARAQGLSNQGTPHPVDASNTQVGVEVLSDRGGVDLSSYLQHLVDTLNKEWRPLLKAHAPDSITGQHTTILGVTILPDGHLGAMKIVSSAGNDALDKAAWRATKEDAFQSPPPLRSGSLKLRLNFIVN